jgi:hypothetical protein
MASYATFYLEVPVRGRPITESNRVDYIVRKFRSKYGDGEVKKYI